MNLLIDNPGRLPGYNSTAESELGPADRLAQTFSCILFVQKSREAETNFCYQIAKTKSLKVPTYK